MFLLMSNIELKSKLSKYVPENIIVKYLVAIHGISKECNILYFSVV